MRFDFFEGKRQELIIVVTRAREGIVRAEGFEGRQGNQT